MLEIVVVEDESMPSGHDWLRYEFDGGHRLAVFSESFVREYGHMNTLRATDLLQSA